MIGDFTLTLFQVICNFTLTLFQVIGDFRLTLFQVIGNSTLTLFQVMVTPHWPCFKSLVTSHWPCFKWFVTPYSPCSSDWWLQIDIVLSDWWLDLVSSDWWLHIDLVSSDWWLHIDLISGDWWLYWLDIAIFRMVANFDLMMLYFRWLLTLTSRYLASPTKETSVSVVTVSNTIFNNIWQLDSKMQFIANLALWCCHCLKSVHLHFVSYHWYLGRGGVGEDWGGEVRRRPQLEPGLHVICMCIITLGGFHIALKWVFASAMN